jgi:hypothetical protein
MTRVLFYKLRKVSFETSTRSRRENISIGMKYKERDT